MAYKRKSDAIEVVGEESVIRMVASIADRVADTPDIRLMRFAQIMPVIFTRNAMRRTLSVLSNALKPPVARKPVSVPWDGPFIRPLEVNNRHPHDFADVGLEEVLLAMLTAPNFAEIALKTVHVARAETFRSADDAQMMSAAVFVNEANVVLEDSQERLNGLFTIMHFKELCAVYERIKDLAFAPRDAQTVAKIEKYIMENKCHVLNMVNYLNTHRKPRKILVCITGAEFSAKWRMTDILHENAIADMHRIFAMRHVAAHYARNFDRHRSVIADMDDHIPRITDVRAMLLLERDSQQGFALTPSQMHLAEQFIVTADALCTRHASRAATLISAVADSRDVEAMFLYVETATYYAHTRDHMQTALHELLKNPCVKIHMDDWSVLHESLLDVLETDLQLESVD